MVWVNANIDVDLSEVEDDELLEEVERRKLKMTNLELVQQLHDAYILKKTDVVDRILRDLFHEELGRIV